MFRKLIIAILMMVPVMAFAQKFGTVDTEAIIPNLPEYKDAQAAVDAASKKYEAELQALQEKLRKDGEAIQGIMDDPETPETIKQRRYQEFQEQQQKIQQFYETAQQELQQMNARQMQPIVDRVTQAIQAVGTENGFTMIFPTQMPLFIGTDAVDVTPLVKTKLGI